MKSRTPFSIFTWHIHGSYLYYLSQGDYLIYIPVTPDKKAGYTGRGTTFPFGNNVIEVPAAEVKNMNFDCILFQSKKNWVTDQYEILSEQQRQLPRIYLEHDPPLQHPTDTQHTMNDPDVVMVHVSHFNKLMWNCNSNRIKVIDHGVINPGVEYQGELDKGIVVVNNLFERGRRVGPDIFEKVAKIIPLDLIGMGTEKYGGLGEVIHSGLPEFISHYRFFFNPIRYTSLGLAVIEAMMTGLPVVALATTEYVTVIQNKKTGFINTDIDCLIDNMQFLLENKQVAKEMGLRGKDYADERFDIKKFTEEWENIFELVVDKNKVYEEENRIYK